MAVCWIHRTAPEAPLVVAEALDGQGVEVRSQRTRRHDIGRGGGGGPVAFSIARMGRLLPEAEALELSVEYASVVVTGRAEPVEEPAEKRRALELLMEKYAHRLRTG